MITDNTKLHNKSNLKNKVFLQNPHKKNQNLSLWLFNDKSYRTTLLILLQ